MSDEDRIARLTELARKVWPDAQLEEAWSGFCWLDIVGSSDRSYVRFWTEHPRALDALETALCVLAGEPPQWALELAEQWRAQADYPDREDKRTLEGCADELLTVAKGQP